MKYIILCIATGVYTGFFPYAAGTFGTIPALILAWFFLGDLSWFPVIAWATAAVSVWSAQGAEKFLGHDSKKIVIDEWAGMFFALAFLPHRLDVYIASFIFFRFYDVIKPYPANTLEGLPGGWGVTADDLMAGIYANLTCWLFIVGLRALGWFGF